MLSGEPCRLEHHLGVRFLAIDFKFKMLIMERVGLHSMAKSMVSHSSALILSMA